MIEIGQKLTASYKLDYDYEERTNDAAGHKQLYRLWKKEPLPGPIDVYLIGVRYKQEGWYNKGRLYGPSYFEMSEVEPPFLSHVKTVKCALVTPSIKQNGFLILWEDVDGGAK